MLIGRNTWLYLAKMVGGLPHQWPSLRISKGTPFSLQNGKFHDGPAQIYAACLFIFTKQSCAKLFHPGLHPTLNTIKGQYGVVWAMLHFPTQHHCFMNGCRLMLSIRRWQRATAMASQHVFSVGQVQWQNELSRHAVG